MWKIRGSLPLYGSRGKEYIVERNGEVVVHLHLDEWQRVLPTLERNSVDVCVTSPPYNLNKRHSSGGKTKTAKSMTKKYEEWYADDIPEWEYQGQQQALIHELMRVCKSSIFYNHKIRYAWHNRNTYKNENKIYHPMHWLHKFPIWCEIIWDRCGIGNPSSRYHIQEERIWQIKKPKMWGNSEGLTNIWKIPPTKNEHGHPCSFPRELVRRCLSPTTVDGWKHTVIDPYVGSGTTGIEALLTERKFIGVERNPQYFDLACTAIKNHIEEYYIKGQGQTWSGM